MTRRDPIRVRTAINGHIGHGRTIKHLVCRWAVISALLATLHVTIELDLAPTGLLKQTTVMTGWTEKLTDHLLINKYITIKVDCISMYTNAIMVYLPLN